MSTQSAVTIPPDLKKKFPKLIALILGSESMNDEERQYWINILPVMSEDQQKNLEEILQNEKDQLAAIDAKYAKEMESMGVSEKSVEEMAKERKERREKRRKGEAEGEVEEERKEQEILRAIEGLEG